MKLHEALAPLTVPDLKNLRALTPSGDRSTLKSEILEAIARYLLSGDLGQIWHLLSELEVSAIAEAVHNWGGGFDAQAFKAKYGALPAHFQSRGYVWGRDRKSERPDLLPLFFYAGEIPDDLCPRLAQLAPRPAELPLASLDDTELPQTVGADGDKEAPRPLRRIATETLVEHDLPVLLQLIERGGLAVSAKTGLPGAAGMLKLEAVLEGGDWYAPDDDLGLERWAGGPIRPIRPFAWPLLLQVGGLAKLEGSKLALTPRGNKALSRPIAETVAHLFARWQAKGAPDELRRVDLIKGQTGKSAHLTATAGRRAVIAGALRECPVGRWVAVDELFRQMQIRGHRFAVTENPWGLYVTDAEYGALGYEGFGGFEILQARYILVYLFEYLATLGLIDVAYTLPYGARPDYGHIWGTDSYRLLSRYDGLRYFRINALGAYCLGLAADYRPLREALPPLLEVESDQALVLLREPQPGERLMLERIARPLERRRWGLDREALLRLSADAQERERIREFLESAAGGPLPESVRQLLDDLAERATALVDAGPARLIRCRDAATAALLATDPATAPCCARTGDRVVCVPVPKLAAFRKGLARLGFVLPESA